MKTLFQITTVAVSGSVGRIAEEIGQLVIKAGWDSYIAHGRGYLPSKSKLIQIGTKRDVFCHFLQTRLFDRHGLASKKATKILIKQIEAIRPDVIHLHNIHGYFLNYEILFEYLSTLKIPILWTLHDCWSFTGHCYHPLSLNCERWISGCYNCPQKKNYPKSLLMDRSFQNYKDKKKAFTSVERLVIIPVSDWLSKVVRASFLNQVTIHRIHNGVNVEVFRPRSNSEIIKNELGISERKMVLGVTNVWTDRKGLSDFIKLSSLIKETYSIVLVGLSPQQIKILPDNIIGITRTENIDRLAELYSAADVFVNPTWEDSFPTTNLEALACGTPIITYRTGGSIEAVSSITGLIVEQGEINMLVHAIETICKYGKKKYVDVCREHAIRYFRKEDRYAEYLQLYDDLISRI